MRFLLRFEVLMMRTTRVRKVNKLKIQLLLDILWMFWERFSSVLVISTHDSIAWMSISTRWVLKLLQLIVKWVWVLALKSYMMILLHRDRQKPPNHHPMHKHFISFAFASVTPCLTFFDNVKGGEMYQLMYWCVLDIICFGYCLVLWILFPMWLLMTFLWMMNGIV